MPRGGASPAGRCGERQQWKRIKRTKQSDDGSELYNCRAQTRESFSLLDSSVAAFLPSLHHPALATAMGVVET